MFIRFRQGQHRLQVSIVETRRVDGKVRHEHVAGLGSIEMPSTVAARFAFWRGVHERFGRLGNRVDGETRGRLLGAIHERVPMVTPDEQRMWQRENLEADEKFWDDLHDMHAGTVEGTKGLIANAERQIDGSQAELAKAAAGRDAAKAALDRLDRREDVAGGLGKRMTSQDLIKIMRAAGWTAKDFRNAARLVEIDRLGGSNEVTAEVVKRHRSSELAASRAVLRRRRRGAEGFE
jgi:hypothetical protein